ncbi:uncharacterized protein [Ptychodera flava]|uniref:uncharacterized protein n=1 Tax=Ptychodera flava TaxID=63121 RepID=UPI00396A0A56
MGYVKRKGTKAVKKIVTDFPAIKENFLQRITEIIKEFNIPPEMIINWDQTGVAIIPAGDWTIWEAEGSRQVTIAGLDDKRQITAVFAASAAGDFLPPQLLYQGKTDRCHPIFNFPENWDIHHTESHWSNQESMKRYIDKVIIPHVEATRTRLQLPADQRGIAIFDVYKAHRGEDLLKKQHFSCVCACLLH